jgi:putative addiction module killer protein
MEVTARILEIYQDENGKTPFEVWFHSLKDRMARRKIRKRLDRAEEGNLGECNSVGEGVYEMKIDYGPGYRIYFGQEGPKLTILLCGGDKSTQQKDIKKAQTYWFNYSGRKTK